MEKKRCMWIDGTTMYVLINCKGKSLKAVLVETYWITTKLKAESYIYVFIYVHMYLCMLAFDICV
jgi:hypothetical protein